MAPKYAEDYFLGDSWPPDAGGDEVYERITIALETHSVDVKRVTRGTRDYLGRLHVRRGGFTIEIREDLPITTFRFILAHELSHVLAYQNANEFPSRRFDNTTAEERLCSSIARHLLLPEALTSSLLANVLSGKEVSFETLEEAAIRFTVSPWQVLYRCLDSFARLDVCAVLWRMPEDLIPGVSERSYFRALDKWTPPGIYIPTKDRIFEAESSNDALWTYYRGDENPHYARGPVAVGTLSGTLESVVWRSTIRKGQVIQLIFLDEAHKEKAKRWRFLNGDRFR